VSEGGFSGGLRGTDGIRRRGVSVASRPSTRASKLPVTQLVFVARGVFPRSTPCVCVLRGFLPGRVFPDRTTRRHGLVRFPPDWVGLAGCVVTLWPRQPGPSWDPQSGARRPGASLRWLAPVRQRARRPRSRATVPSATTAAGVANSRRSSRPRRPGRPTGGPPANDGGPVVLQCGTWPARRLRPEGRPCLRHLDVRRLLPRLSMRLAPVLRHKPFMGLRGALRRTRRRSRGRIIMRPRRTVARTIILAMGPVPGAGDRVTLG